MKGRVNSRAKGKRVELAAAKFLTSLGLGTIVRSAQCKGNANSGDLCFADGSPLPVHIEVKGGSAMDIGTKALDDAVRQAKKDAGDGNIWAVLWKRNNTRWRISGYFRTYVGLNCVMTADETYVKPLLSRFWYGESE